MKVDKEGVHTEVTATAAKDKKIGAHIQVGLGIGIKINLNQAEKAFKEARTSIQHLGNYLLNNLVPDWMQLSK